MMKHYWKWSACYKMHVCATNYSCPTQIHSLLAARRKHTRGHIVLGPSDAGTVARAPSSIGSDAALSSGGGASIYAAARVSAYV
jgi:hypothetical protein